MFSENRGELAVAEIKATYVGLNKWRNAGQMAGNTKNYLIISKLFALWSKIMGTCNLFLSAQFASCVGCITLGFWQSS